MTLYDGAVVTSGLFYPEGPVALPDGSVIVCELASGNLVRVNPDGSKEIVAHTDGAPNGLAVGPDGRIYIANSGGNAWRWDGDRPIFVGTPDDYIGGRIEAVDLNTGEVELIAEKVHGHPLAGPNDLVFDEFGNLYFTDFGKPFAHHFLNGGLCYLPRDAHEATAVAWPLETANGVGLSPDGRRIYVSETKTAHIWAWDIESPGVLRTGHTPGHPGGGDLLCTLPGYVWLDSLAVDGVGNICVATMIRGVITVVEPTGHIAATVTLPDHDASVTNICFGGADLRDAFVTGADTGKLFKLRWPWPGHPLYFNITA
jgi:gluconolactonase